METWEVVILCLLALFVGIAILMLTDVKEKIRRKRHPKWYEHYDRALGNSFTIGSRFREKTETLNKRREMIQEMLFHGECTTDEYKEASKTIDKEFEEAIRWFEFNKEALGIEADLREADAYAREHNLKWGILRDGPT